MSLDARIVAIAVHCAPYCEYCKGEGIDPDGEWDVCEKCHGGSDRHPVVRILLEPREDGGVAGQQALTVVDPPTIVPSDWEPLIGWEIWGAASTVFVGDTPWAIRESHTKIRIV